MRSSYTVSVGDQNVRVMTFQEVQSVVMETLTSVLARDPEAVAKASMIANRAFSVGTVEHALDAQGSWQTNVTVHGEVVKIVVVKELV